MINLVFALMTIAPNGSPDSMFPDHAELQTVDSLKANPDLPDPLLLMNGKKISTKAEWERVRKPELRTLFQHYMYGYFPKQYKIHATVEREDKGFFGGKATERIVNLEIGPKGSQPIHLALFVPNRRSQPAAAFVGIAFCGIYSVVDDPNIPLPTTWMFPGQGVVNNRATEAGRGACRNVWNVEKTLDRGYAVAIFYNGDVEPDLNGNHDGIRSHITRSGAHEPDPLDWHNIAAWAWGIQRVVDYLVTVKEIDPKRIAAVGHSRNGKATLLAAAFDDRIALAIPLQAGCGGTAPSRGKVGESVKAINDHFPHWFNANFKQFNDRPELLPFDQNCLAALCAPRPVLFSNAEEDSWANPDGQFEALKAADPVYRLYGVEGVGSSVRPPINQLLKSRLGYYIRPGKHSMTSQDWDAFLDYADRWLK